MDSIRQLQESIMIRDNLLDRGCFTSCSRSGAEQNSAAEKVQGYAAVGSIELLQPDNVLAKLTECIRRF